MGQERDGVDREEAGPERWKRTRSLDPGERAGMMKSVAAVALSSIGDKLTD